MSIFGPIPCGRFCDAFSQSWICTAPLHRPFSQQRTNKLLYINQIPVPIANTMPYYLIAPNHKLLWKHQRQLSVIWTELMLNKNSLNRMKVSKIDNLKVMAISRSNWPGVQRWQVRQDLNLPLKLSTFIRICVYHQAQHYDDDLVWILYIWGDTKKKKSKSVHYLHLCNSLHLVTFFDLLFASALSVDIWYNRYKHFCLSMWSDDDKLVKSSIPQPLWVPHMLILRSYLI